jgi:UDP-N-acetyl-D-glucosamine/UDP-N-acetyl-D-galactosamine dehydrogenase
MDLEDLKIGVIGLGYVGLPLAVEFSKKFLTVGFDINSSRIIDLKKNIDATLEVTSLDLKNAIDLSFTNDIKILKECNFYIITVPTPINQANQPDLDPLVSASNLVGEILKPGDIVVYESTVYPGATEEVCIPILEKMSKLICFNMSNLDDLSNGFYVGYSPERVNPGDKSHTVANIIKITSGSTLSAAQFIDRVYREIISAGTHLANSIRIAEAAKVIENTQRDVNIALINEFAMLFDLLDIDTEEVLKAAGTKWNFLPFSPGLVGGHCIGVDPYYLTHKAQLIGYHPEIILAGRRINDGMGSYVVQRLVKEMVCKEIPMVNAKVLIMGLTFKENCPDIRNTKVIDIIDELQKYNIEVDVYDPWVSNDDALKEYNINLIKKLDEDNYDGIILAVSHKQFLEMGVSKIKKLGHKKSIVFDVKCLFPSDTFDIRL